MNKKKKELLVAVLGIIGVLVLTIGVTYSLLRYMREGSTENSITTGKITFLYTETSFGRGIELIDAMPLSDADGKKQIGDKNVFDFKITADTISNVVIPYTVTVVKQEVELNKELKESDVKLYITEVNGGKEEYGQVGKFNDDSKFEKYNGSNVERIIYKGKVPSNKEGYIQNLRLKMWISDDAEFSPLKDNDGNYIIENGEYKYPNNGKTFKVKVNVYANGGVLTDTEVAQESQASMLSLKVGEESLTEKTAGSKLYETTLPEGTTETELEIETSTEYQKVKIEKTESDYSTVIGMNNDARTERMTATKKLTLPLTAGENYFKITVTPEDGKSDSEVYKLHITVEKVFSLAEAIFEAYPKPTGQEDYIELDNDINSSTYAFNDISDNKNQNGLYKSTYKVGEGSNQETKTSYYFRGNVQNYLDFAGLTWRVVRINEDGSIRIILNGWLDLDTYPILHDNSKVGTNMYFTNWTDSLGYAKGELNDWYAKTINSNPKYVARMATGTYYFCEQAKVTTFANQSSGTGITLPVYNQYVPNYRCEATGNDDDGYYGPVDTKVGLLTYDEAIMAGGYPYFSYTGGYNSYWYLRTATGNGFWTMSPAGIESSNATVWIFRTKGAIDANATYARAHNIRPVINLNPQTTVEGSGTSSEHWVVTN